jgi:hypothetical protein
MKVPAVINLAQNISGNVAALSQFAGKIGDRIGDVPHRLNVFLNLLHASYLKSASLVGVTERAFVPGTIPGHANQKAVRFAGRPDRALFKKMIHHVFTLKKFSYNDPLDKMTAEF